MNPKHVALIMAGGQGTRFWPYSTAERPKQFLSLVGGSPLILQTFERLKLLVPEENIYAVADERYRRLVLEAVPAFRPDNYIAEPSPRNTAPCLMMANIVLRERHPDACVLVAPADHFIADLNTFEKQMADALDFAEQRVMVTCGIKPNMPHTGYGYIHFSERDFEKPGQTPFHRILQFTEKPPLEQARLFVDSGNYLWNSGMFIYNLTHFRDFLSQYASDYFSGYQKLEQTIVGNQSFREIFNRLPKQSIDYALMEKVKEAVVMPADFGWNDVGAWLSIHELNDKDSRGNVNIGGNVLLDTNNSLVFSAEKKPVAVLGVDGLAVIQTAHGILVAPLDQLQRVKEIVAELK